MGTLFRENGIEFEQINYFKQPLTTAIVKDLIEKLNIPAFGLLRIKEKSYQEFGFDENTRESEVIDAIVANPNLLNRPIVVVGDKAVIARPIEKALELLK